MIIVKLMGGLGNQMFQYAVARHLSINCNSPLKLDLNWFVTAQDGCTPRSYLLNQFQVVEEIASVQDIRFFKTNNMLFSFFNRLVKPLRLYYRERNFHFDPNLLLLRQHVYLDGYWQSERYFSAISEVIRDDLSFKYPAAGLNKHLAEQIQDNHRPTVAVHFRRGDYASDPKIAKFHGVCPNEYYTAAINRITAGLVDPIFYIFSDDNEWAVNHFHSQVPFHVVSLNGPDKGVEDLRLMTLCKHHIIANSTFSWWGAWLCRNPGKIVIAPQRWFNDPRMNLQDLIPDTWIRI